MSAEFSGNALNIMIEVFNKNFPMEHPVFVGFMPTDKMPMPEEGYVDERYAEEDLRNDGPAGFTNFSDDESLPIDIVLSLDVPMLYLPMVLAEELAHAYLGHEAGHGPEFQRVMDKIVELTQEEMFKQITPEGVVLPEEGEQEEGGQDA